ncbi:hypothetical protein OSCT_1515 [Oscillochloris trichoides DG-6]|uniref:Uncharacterized protein n=1 Tax=Oscillochloris trichoides DG-6 TaxID=765420 RepID=E1IDW4_9CHLR|nr:hypothetical protein OSCT_1515 [Oscillochloris trichoides DG-6]
MNVIRHHLQAFNRHAQRIGLFVQEGFQPVGNLPVQHLAPVLRAPDNVLVQRLYAARVPDVAHRTHVLSIANHSMPVKYLRETEKLTVRRFPCRLKADSPRTVALVYDL